MWRQIRIAVALGGLGVLSLGAFGCSSQGGSPRALTGDEQQARASSREIARWTDDKGRFHPDWRVGVNRPPGYPRSIPE